MGRSTKEFQAFDSMMEKLLTVPKSTIHERHAEHKKRAALNPNKRGPKPKIKPPSGDPSEA
jgi:hypothetical protein